MLELECYVKAFRRLGYNLTCKVLDLGGVWTRVAQVSGTTRYCIAPPSRTIIFIIIVIVIIIGISILWSLLSLVWLLLLLFDWEYRNCVKFQNISDHKNCECLTISLSM